MAPSSRQGSQQGLEAAYHSVLSQEDESNKRSLPAGIFVCMQSRTEAQGLFYPLLELVFLIKRTPPRRGKKTNLIISPTGVPGGVLLEVSRLPIDSIKHHKYNKESFNGQPVAVFICCLDTRLARSPPTVKCWGSDKELGIGAYPSFMAANNSLVLILQASI